MLILWRLDVDLIKPFAAEEIRSYARLKTCESIDEVRK
jgi:hypothetical protein